MLHVLDAMRRTQQRIYPVHINRVVCSLPSMFLNVSAQQAVASSSIDRRATRRRKRSVLSNGRRGCLLSPFWPPSGSVSPCLGVVHSNEIVAHAWVLNVDQKFRISPCPGMIFVCDTRSRARFKLRTSISAAGVIVSSFNDSSALNIGRIVEFNSISIVRASV
jgi:hypothetical protein